MLDESERDAYVRHLLETDDQPPLDPPESKGSGFLLALWYIFVVCLILFLIIRFAHWAWTF